MKGDKGTCTIDTEVKEGLRKTKFDTETNCKAALQSLINIGVMPKDYVIYKCKSCHNFHFGRPDEKIKFGK